MPRPSEGYFNAAGLKVPGVHDVTGRFKESKGLIHWAYGQGKAGRELYEPRALDVGTVVHRMCELDLRGAPDPAISKVPADMLAVRDDIDTALRCYAEFRMWRQEHDVRVVSLEESLVSERHQYGGTHDVVAVIDGRMSLLDLKTAKTARDVFLDQRLAMAAHGVLWREHHPARPLKCHHLVQLPKDGSAFAHHTFEDLSMEWAMFALQLECWCLEERQRGRAREARQAARKGGKDKTGQEAPSRPDPRDAEIARLKDALARARTQPAGRPRTVKPAPKLRLAEPVVEAVETASSDAAEDEDTEAKAVTLPPAAAAAPSSWGEMLRSFGHIST